MVMVNKKNIRTLLGISNHPIKTLGEINLEITIGPNIILHNFHIVTDTFPVEANGVIGNDFLTKNNAILNYGSCKFIINNHPMEMIC